MMKAEVAVDICVAIAGGIAGFVVLAMIVRGKSIPVPGFVLMIGLPILAYRIGSLNGIIGGGASVSFAIAIIVYYVLYIMYLRNRPSVTDS